MTRAMQGYFTLLLSTDETWETPWPQEGVPLCVAMSKRPKGGRLGGRYGMAGSSERRGSYTSIAFLQVTMVAML